MVAHSTRIKALRSDQGVCYACKIEGGEEWGWGTHLLLASENSSLTTHLYGLGAERGGDARGGVFMYCLPWPFHH